MKVFNAEEGFKNSQEYDFIIVGAGSAGATIASRLAEDSNVTVALIEAGTQALELEAKIPAACGKMQKSVFDWGFVTEKSPNSSLALKDNRMLWPRGKCLGGSSVLNYMAYVRGAKEDFNIWENDFGAVGWGWNGVLPYFKKSEDFLSSTNAVFIDKEVHGTGGPLGISLPINPIKPVANAFIESAKQLGFQNSDYNNGNMFGVVSLFQQTIRNGSRSDTCTAFLAGNENNGKNLFIFTYSQATSLLLNENGNNCIGVEIADLMTSNNNRYKLLAKKEVIVSCGAIQSPHLLMLSGIGPEQELEQVGIKCKVNNPKVGKDMEDHICNFIRFEPKTKGKDLGNVNSYRAEGIPKSIPQIIKWAINGIGVLSSPCYDATLFYKSDVFKKSAPSYGPDAQIGIFCSTGDSQFFEQNFNMKDSENYHKKYYESHDNQGFIMVPTLLHPFSRGELKLKSKNPFDHPIIHHNYFSDERDVLALNDMYRKCLELGKTTAMRSLDEFEPIFDPEMVKRHNGDIYCDDFLREFSYNTGSTLYHPTSTCKIGSVVDENLKVYGVSNLRIADASIMPTIISGNTNAPTIMIGEKVSAMIKKEYNMNQSITVAAPMKFNLNIKNMILSVSVLATAGVIASRL